VPDNDDENLAEDKTMADRAAKFASMNNKILK
jgi:hypothetical protein